MHGKITRRDLLKMAGAGTAACLVPKLAKAAVSEKPNFLFIVTDQQTLGALSVEGNRWVKTPHMDRLAARGIRFAESYCTYPLCSPARASLFTSRMPHALGVTGNDHAVLPRGTPTMGTFLRRDGYETAYAGKWHVPVVYPGYGRPIRRGAIPGFDVLPLAGKAAKFRKGPTNGMKVDVAVTDAAVEFLRRPHKKPFLLVHSILNPHDICGYPRNLDEFAHIDPGDPLPPLPANFNAAGGEPTDIQRAREKCKDWTDEQWRKYIGVYYRLVETADSHVGRIMKALDESGQADRTIVIFTSDHGEMRASHRLTTKKKFYEEAAAVPLIVCVPGVTTKATVDSSHLVSGLDILPTICDYAGLPVPAFPEARSLRPLVEGHSPPWREAVFSELVARGAPARMVRTARYKYIAYASGENREQLFDMQEDPGETKNLVTVAAAQEILATHRGLLREYCERIKDPFPAGT